MNNIVYSASVLGVEAYKIEIEIDNNIKVRQKDRHGITKTIDFNILGLQSHEVKQSRERILKSIENNSLEIKACKLVVNLYPYKHNRTSSFFDLPIAIGILLSNDLIKLTHKFIKETIIIGELSLDGKVRPIKGILAIAYAAKNLGIKRLIVPKMNSNEAAAIEGLEVLGVDSLNELLSYFRKQTEILPTIYKSLNKNNPVTVDFSEVKGHQQAKRAFQIAAAGRHNIILVGSPGSGKTMLAQRLHTIMPDMTNSEIIETSKIYSITNKLDGNDLITQRPYREPHHSASTAGLIGGGQWAEPGEISLAHNGILFMDEFVEFKRSSLEALRQPLESQTITISRANQNISYPASFLLIAALNPCPCGFAYDPKNKCCCSNLQINSYFHKISGPVIDRIDLQLTLNSVGFDTMNDKSNSISSSDLMNKISIAYDIQMKRCGSYNGLMSVKDIDKYCITTESSKKLLEVAFEKLKMSSRSYHKILKISRTIADLDGDDIIDIKHIKEALMYRSLDKKFKD